MLKRVSIQNFKSLKDVTLDLQKVNLLIGPNNSGKTNFLKALEFFTVGNINLQSTADLESITYKHKRIDIKYEFDYIPNPNGYLSKKFGTEGRDIYHFSYSSEIKTGDSIVYVDSLKDDWFTDPYGNRLETETFGGDRSELFEYVATKIFRPDPLKLLKPARFSADEVQLSADCSNLISFYFYIYNSLQKTARDIQDSLSRCIPEISYFTTPPVKDRNESLIGLKFFDKEENGYWADEVSEGVLYFLALLCIVHQPNPPKLLLLEEPEKGIHPRRIKEIMEFVRQLAFEKDVQVIMTTHSPILLDEFADSPESVFIFDKDDAGATLVRNLQTDIIEPTNRKNEELGLEPIHYTDALGEYWTIGFLGGIPK